jgi:hypothetical protein
LNLVEDESLTREELRAIEKRITEAEAPPPKSGGAAPKKAKKS